MFNFLFDIGMLSQILNSLRLPVLLAIAIIYAAYDLFNKRDIPDIIAYASVAVGIIFTLTLDMPTMIYSILVALVVGSLSYLLYRSGQLGLGDGFEFVTLSLIIPIQPVPVLGAVFQLGLPFILSIFVGTGFAAIILVPIYYLLVMKKSTLKDTGKKNPNMMIKAGIMLLAYASLFLFMTYYFGFNPIAFAIIALIAIPSVIMMVYERRIMLQMIKLIPANEVEAGDIIATDLMNKAEFSYFKAKDKNFGKLATQDTVKRISILKKRLPVYRNAIPLAFPTLIGVVISVLVGNLLLFII